MKEEGSVGILDREQCLARACPPHNENSEGRTSGHYFRGLRKKDSRRRVEKKDTTPPAYGYIFKTDLWRWDDDGLSVSICSCTCAECTALLLPSPESYPDVVEINLHELCSAVNVSLRAYYSPVAEPIDEQNPCHFIFFPDRASVEDVRTKINDYFDRYREPRVKPPQDPPTRALLMKAKQMTDPVFRMHKSVRGTSDAKDEPPT